MHPSCKRWGGGEVTGLELRRQAVNPATMRAGQTQLPSFQARHKEYRRCITQHRDSPELMVSHCFFWMNNCTPNDVFGFVLKIIWQLAWELVPSTLSTFFWTYFEYNVSLFGDFSFRYSVYKDQQAGWISTPSTGLLTPLQCWTASPHSSTAASTLPSSWQLTVVSNFFLIPISVYFSVLNISLHFYNSSVRPRDVLGKNRNVWGREAKCINTQRVSGLAQVLGSSALCLDRGQSKRAHPVPLLAGT